MEGNRQKNSIKSVLMTFDVLEAVAEAGQEIGISELAVQLVTTKPTVFRHVQTLLERGYLIQNPQSSRYSLGVAAWILGQNAERSNDLLKATEQAVRDLRDETGLTVVVAVAGSSGLTVLSTLTGTGWLEIGVKSGTELLLHANAQGKVALAWGKLQWLELLKRKPLCRLTEYTVVDYEQLIAEVDRVKMTGFARAYQEETLGISALGAPLLGDSSVLRGTLALVGTVQHINSENEEALISALKRTATRISWNLGFKGELPGKS